MPKMFAKFDWSHAQTGGVHPPFWATVCKTVRSMLSDCCLSCPVCLFCLSVTLVYCGQTVGWIKMKLGVQVASALATFCQMGTQLPLSQRGTAPEFSAHICSGQMAGWIKVPLGMEVGLGPHDLVLDGDPAPLLKSWRTPTIFGPFLLWPNSCMYRDTTWYGGRPQPKRHSVTCGPSSPPLKGMCPPIFGQCPLWPNGWMD